MMKTTVKINQEGEPYIVLPDDIIEELVIEEGDVVYVTEVNGEVVLTF